MFCSLQLLGYSLSSHADKIVKSNSKFPGMILIGTFRKYWTWTDLVRDKGNLSSDLGLLIPGGFLGKLDIKTSDKTKRKANSV